MPAVRLVEHCEVLDIQYHAHYTEQASCLHYRNLLASTDILHSAWDNLALAGECIVLRRTNMVGIVPYICALLTACQRVRLWASTQNMLCVALCGFPSDRCSRWHAAVQCTLTHMHIHIAVWHSSGVQGVACISTTVTHMSELHTSKLSSVTSGLTHCCCHVTMLLTTQNQHMKGVFDCSMQATISP